MNQVVIDYLQKNKDLYTKEALITQLKASGFSEGDIDGGVDIVYNNALSDVVMDSKYNITRAGLFFLLAFLYAFNIGALVMGIMFGIGLNYLDTWQNVFTYILYASFIVPFIGMYSIIFYRNTYITIGILFLSNIVSILILINESHYLWIAVREWIRIEVIVFYPLLVAIMVYTGTIFFRSVKTKQEPAYNYVIIIALLIFGLSSGGLIGLYAGYSFTRTSKEICDIGGTFGMLYQDKNTKHYNDKQGNSFAWLAKNEDGETYFVVDVILENYQDALGRLQSCKKIAKNYTIISESDYYKKNIYDCFDGSYISVSTSNTPYEINRYRYGRKTYGVQIGEMRKDKIIKSACTHQDSEARKECQDFDLNSFDKCKNGFNELFTLKHKI